MARHVIVDGSNIATEGRAMPSLKQLNEAVTAFMQEFPDDVITVVVDATFGHRIDPSEVPEFDEAVAHNELVAPPAGAIGRGDSFILSIANKTKGSILTNDSYQEFHGEYPWVFDEGRLIGGKPVPNVGWVFVLRTPVRGPVSRKSVRAGRSVDKNTGRVPRASKEASRPMPVPKAPPPGATIGKGARTEAPTVDGQQPAPVPAGRSADGGRRRGRRDASAAVEAARAEVAPAAASTPRPAPARDEPVNELMAFINFVEHHPVGSSVNAVVESYSSHGAYVAVGDVRGYVPLRLMSDPPARSARELGKVGDAVTLVVHSFTPARRSIDMAVPAAAIKDGVAPTTVPVEPHAAETAAIAEAAVIATAADTTAGEAFAAPATPPAKPGRRPRKAAAATAGEVPLPLPGGEPVEPATAGAPDAGPTDPAPVATKASKRAGKRPAPQSSIPEPTPAASPAPKRSRRPAATDAAPAPAPVADPTPVPAKRTARTTARIAAGLAAETVPAPAPAKRAAKKAAAAATATPAAPEPAPTEPATARKAPAKKAAVAANPKAPRTAVAKQAAATAEPLRFEQTPAAPAKRVAKQAATPAESTDIPTPRKAARTAKAAPVDAAPAKRAAAKRAPAATTPQVAKKAPAKRSTRKPAES